jgi:predicted ATP-dependent serine protease
MSRKSVCECTYCGSPCAKGKTVCNECEEWESTNNELGLEEFKPYTETEAIEARDKFCMLMTWELVRPPTVWN